MDWLRPPAAAVLAALPDAVVAADRSNRIVAVNPALERLLARPADELVGQPLTVLMPERYHSAHLEGFERVATTGTRRILGDVVRVPALRADGTEVPVDLTVARMDLDGEPYFLGTLRDVRDRVNLEHRQAVATRLLEVLAATDSIEQAGPRTLAAIGTELGWQAACLWVVDESKLRLRCAAMWRAPGVDAQRFGLVTEMLAFTPGERLPGEVWQDGKPAWVEDVREDPDFIRAAAAVQDGLLGACAFPVTASGQVLGVIELLSHDARKPDQALLDTMATIGDLLGEFLERWLEQEALAASQERLGLALTAGRMGTWELDLGANELVWSEQAADLLGVGRLSSSLDSYLDRVHPEDQERVRDALEDVRTEGTDLRVEHRVLLEDGSLRWIEAVGRVVRNAAGRRVLVGVASDVTERKASEHRQEQLLVEQQESRRRVKFLSDASAELAASLDHRRALAAVARRVVPELADWCRVYGYDGQGSLFLTTSEAANPSAAALLDELDARFPPHPADPFGPGRAARTGNPEFHPEVDQGLLARAAHSAEHLALLARLGLRSYIAVPMAVHGRVVGVFTMGLNTARPKYGAQELSLAEELGRRAAQAIENSRLYTDVERGARALQASLLPPDLPDIPGLEVAARYRPMGTAEVGGDFYDLFPLRGATWGIVVGDVRGKGVAAAGVTGLARWAVRGAAMQTKHPHRVLANLNEAMLAADDGEDPRFCTVVFARLRPREHSVSLAVSSGGHPLPLIIRADGEIAPVGGAGMLVGALPEATFETGSTVLGPGDTVVFYTDGVLEARQGQELLGDDGFQELLRQAAGRSPQEIIAHIEAQVDAMVPGPRDDIALVVARATGGVSTGPSIS